MLRIKLFLILSFFAFQPAGMAQWKFQSGKVQFEITNAGLTVSGHFGDVKGEVQFNPTNPKNSSIHATIEVSELETGIGLRNNHLKKKEYFDLENFPSIQMKLLRMDGSGSTFKGVFALTIKGTTQNVEIPISLAENGNTATLKSSFTIDRRDFKVGGRSLFMSDDVLIHITAQLKV